MKFSIKSKLFGSILSDGSFKFLPFSNYTSQQTLNIKNIDIINHAIWTGGKAKEQTEISAFVGRFNNRNIKSS